MATSTTATRDPRPSTRLHESRVDRGTDAGRALADWMPLAAVALGVLLLVAAFWSNICHFVFTWKDDENYSHGFLVPLLSLYFAREAARGGPMPRAGGLGLGVGLLLLAILGRLVTVVVPIGILADLAFIVGLAGLVALCAGTPALRRYLFPLAFLVFMVPLPVALYTSIASPLQLLVSKLAAAVLNASGIPVLQRGNMMTLPGGLNLFVAEACSGMRQLTGFLALTTAVAYLTRRPLWYRAILVGSSIPIALFANVVRVVLTGAIMYKIDPKFALGSFHTAEGLLMMGLGLGLLGLECRLLNWALDAPGEGIAPTPTAPEPARARPARSAGWGLPARAALGVALLGTALAAQAGVERAVRTERPEPIQPLATLPLRLGAWEGRDLPTDPAVLRESAADQYLSREYVDTRQPARRLTLWVNFSRLGLNLHHSPEVCLPSGGWKKLESQTRVLEADSPQGVPRRITRLAYQQGELVQGVGFWYYIFGEGRLEEWVRGLPITSRSSHGRTTRGSGLTVEVFCDGEIDPDGAALQEFATALLGELEPRLPDPRAAYHIP
jgi:exosortase